jgi:hypothetical protein
MINEKEKLYIQTHVSVIEKVKLYIQIHVYCFYRRNTNDNNITYISIDI